MKKNIKVLFIVLFTISFTGFSQVSENSKSNSLIKNEEASVKASASKNGNAIFENLKRLPSSSVSAKKTKESSRNEKPSQISADTAITISDKKQLSIDEKEIKPRKIVNGNAIFENLKRLPSSKNLTETSTVHKEILPVKKEEKHSKALASDTSSKSVAKEVKENTLPVIKKPIEKAKVPVVAKVATVQKEIKDSKKLQTTIKSENKLTIAKKPIASPLLASNKPENYKVPTETKVKNRVVKVVEKQEAHSSKAPSRLFDLSDWSLSIPVDNDNNGRADHIKEKELSSGYKNRFFYVSKDGGMVFKCPIGGVKTSQNTSYTRTELREMLRMGNTSIKTKGPSKNNWVLKSSKSAKQAGGYNGKLTATLAVNYVTTTGNSSHKGRVIIGQIHAKHNEPLRLYYRKLPNNKKGSIYFAHEGRDNGEEDFYELIGSKSSTASNPNDGIELNEKFSYVVDMTGNDLTVKILRPNKPTVEKVINIKKSGYSNKDEYMYFKAGVYNQNKSGDSNDYVQATFYELSNSHHGMTNDNGTEVAYSDRKE